MKIFLLVFIVFAANAVQGITGFGGPVLAMPFAMMLIGVKDAKAAITFIAFFTSAIMAVQNRKDINWKETGKMVGIMIFGMIPGMWFFKTMSLVYLKYIYGVIVLLIGLKSLLIKKQFKYTAGLGVATLLAAGVIQGMFTSGGSFVAIYSTAVLKEKKEFRATLSAVWAILNTILVFTNFRAGYMGPEALKAVLICLVPVLLAVYVGGKLTGKINQTVFMKIIYSFLVVSGVVLLLT